MRCAYQHYSAGTARWRLQVIGGFGLRAPVVKTVYACGNHLGFATKQVEAFAAQDRRMYVRVDPADAPMAMREG